MKGIKDSVKGLSDYAVPQDFSRVKLNQNESPVDLPPEIKEEIFRKLSDSSWNRYPPAVPQSLIERLSEYTSFSPSGILLGNGSNELIQTLIYSLCRSGDRIVLVDPGFSVYPRVAAVMEIETVKVPLDDDFLFDAEAIVKAAEGAGLIFLSSPNNPTGTALGIDDVEWIARNAGCYLVLDEAYCEFHGESAQHLIEKIPNFAVLRTFSKGLGLAGIRLGYLLGRKDFVSGISRARLPFSIGIFQQVVGEAILKKSQFIRSCVEEVKSERERLFGELNGIEGIRAIPSRANFILFEVMDMQAGEVFEFLFGNGVVVRRFDNPRLKNMLRVTVGTPVENDVFLRKMKKLSGAGLS
jgi:histidinol-phosphate aminotransferase